MDLFLSISLSGNRTKRVWSLPVVCGRSLFRNSPFIYECCLIGSIHLLGATDTLYLGFAGKTSVNLQ